MRPAAVFLTDVGLTPLLSSDQVERLASRPGDGTSPAPDNVSVTEVTETGSYRKEDTGCLHGMKISRRKYQETYEPYIPTT